VTVTSAASYQPAVAPASIATLFGANLASQTVSAQLDSQGNLPTALAGVSVQVNGEAAMIFFASPTQINFLIPSDAHVGQGAVAVKDADGTVVGTGTVNVSRTAPALFSADATGQGPGAILNAVTYQQAPFFVVTAGNPGSDKQTRLSLFGTGLRLAGDANSAPAGGNVAAYVTATAVVDAQAVSLPVEYAGPAPGFFGLDQVNLVLPGSLDGVGIVNVNVAVGGITSNSVTVQIWSTTAPQVVSFSPSALVPGAWLTVTGASFATTSPVSRNNIIFDAGNGLSATVTALEATATALTAVVPPLASDAQSAWYKGPVTVCVETDGHRTCAAQKLTIQSPSPVTGQPGNLLLQFSQNSNETVLNALEAAGSQQVDAFKQMSAQAQQDLAQKVTAALAGTPQRTTVTLGDGTIVTVVFDVATISKLEALLAAGQTNLGNLLAAVKQQSEKLRTLRAMASASGPSVAASSEQELIARKQLHDLLDNVGKDLTYSQMGMGAGAIIGCVAFPPACGGLALLMAGAAPYFEGLALLDVAGVLTIELGPNSLSSLTTTPSNATTLPWWTIQPLTVQGTFVPKFAPGEVLKDAATEVLSAWMDAAFPTYFQYPVLVKNFVSPVIDVIADGMVALGLGAAIQVSNQTYQNVPLSAYSVLSDCPYGSAPATSDPLFINEWLSEIYGIQVMPGPRQCDFFADTDLLWLTNSPPATSLQIQVQPASEPSNCSTFPLAQSAPFASLYYVSAPAPASNGDRLVVGNPASPVPFSMPPLAGVVGSNPPLPLPRFTNELYCGAVTLAPGCTANAYVPTQVEIKGQFPAFASVLMDPLSNSPFPGGIIPSSRGGPGGIAAWRVQSVQGCSH
jgi:uncharacterized protein (TIGR03437 family)